MACGGARCNAVQPLWHPEAGMASVGVQSTAKPCGSVPGWLDFGVSESLERVLQNLWESIA